MKYDIPNTPTSNQQSPTGKELLVTSVTPENYDVLKALQHDFFDIFKMGVTGEDFIQVVHDASTWYGYTAWNSATDAWHDRDHYIGWHDCQRAERLKLIVTNLRFMPRPRGSGEPNWGGIALREIMKSLPELWEEWYGYRPLLAEIRLDTRSHLSTYFKNNGWIKCSDKNPDYHPTHWIKELVPDARMLLRRKHMEGLDVDDSLEPSFGLLPVPDSLLVSLKEALDCVDDPRAKCSYSIGTVLSIQFMAMVCGCDNLKQVTKFGRRLSYVQTQLLALPYRKKHKMCMEPGYYTYYDLLHEVDMVQVVDVLVPWLIMHESELPSVLAPNTPLITDTLRALIVQFVHFSKLTEKEQHELDRQEKPPVKKQAPQSMMDEIRQTSVLR